MQQAELLQLLNELRSSPAETEWLEFKEAKNDFHFDKIGQYFSAIANEANLKNRDYGWLVFGIEDKARNVVGSNYRPDRLKLECNLATFIPGSADAVIKRDAPPERYRNSMLAHAMVELKMMDTIGSGIKRMFMIQRR